MPDYRKRNVFFKKAKFKAKKVVKEETIEELFHGGFNFFEKFPESLVLSL